MNNNFKLILFCLSLGLFMTSCDKTETTFDDISSDENVRGSVIGVTSVSPGFYNFEDAENTTNTMTIESGGEVINSTIMTISRNGSDPVDLVTFNNFPETYTLTLADAMSAFGLGLEDAEVSDVFSFAFKDVTTASGTYKSTETVSIQVVCPSNIEGTYEVLAVGTSMDSCCMNETTLIDTITIGENDGNNVYDISDWSGGLYAEWYGEDNDAYDITAESVAGTISDDCNEITLLTNVEPIRSDTLSGNGTIDPGTGIINYSWTNGSGDQATVTLTPL